MARQNRTPNGTRASGATSNETHQTEIDDGVSDPYNVKVSLRFIILSILSCLLSSFAVGQIARQILIVGPQQRLIELQAKMEFQERRHKEELEEGSKDVMKLPNPTLKDKPIPNTIYTSMNFDTARSSSINSRWVVMEEGEDKEDSDGVCKKTMSGKEECKAESGKKETVEEIDNGPHYPAGQHLLMDIRNVEEAFLASEERLAKAMLTVVGDCGLTLLSYHCHGLTPSGVSCVGVLLESHVSFHTWPSKGVVTLDLFTCGSQSLLPIVETVENLFGVPRNADGPETVWAYKVRGFGEETDEELADLFTFPIGTMTEYKKELVSIEKTSQNKQRIDVYDVLRPVFQNFESYKRSLLDDGSYESRFKEFFRPDRILFVDGVLQSRRSAEIPYHEALVHPAMVAHKSPSRVLLLNCGGGAALREVLKHRGVKQVVMIEEEPDVIDVSKKFFPEYHDCSNIQGIAKHCMDDTRVELIYNDLHDWIATQYEEETYEMFDVIIMDELYVQSYHYRKYQSLMPLKMFFVCTRSRTCYICTYTIARLCLHSLSSCSYYIENVEIEGDDDDEEDDEGAFAFCLFELLDSDGIFTTQVGDAPTLRTAAQGNPNIQDRFDFIDSLQENGFVRIVDYEEVCITIALSTAVVVQRGSKRKKNLARLYCLS